MKMMRDIAAHHFLISVSYIFWQKKGLLAIADKGFVSAFRSFSITSFDKMIPGFLHVKILHIPSINLKKFLWELLF